MKNLKKRFFPYFIGIRNKIKYGINGPGFAELIFINPQTVNHYTTFRNRWHSGRILAGEWDLNINLSPIESHPKYKACLMRWKENIAWEDTGIYEYMLEQIKLKGGPVDSCYSMEDLLIRYEKLDALFEEVKRIGRFKTHKELKLKSFEDSGILIHLGRDNQPIFGAGGMHRFIIAKILDLENIPAILGVVHPEAIDCWKNYKKEM